MKRLFLLLASSLLATGCYEAEDTGLTRMGREVVAEMNRVGMVVDMSHSAERSTLDAIAQGRAAALLHHRSSHLMPGQPVALPITSSATFHAPDMEGLSDV